MSSEEAIAEALMVEVAPTDRSSPPSTARAEANLLTQRELQVAGLVARGLSNRQIARELVVSDRTVEAHVTHILDKLGFVSRTQVGIWAATHAQLANTVVE